MPRTPSLRPLLYCAGALLSSLIALLLVRPGQAAGDRAGVTVTFGANTQLIGDPSLPNSIQENESSLAASPKNALNLVAGYKDNSPATGGVSCYVSWSADGGGTWNPGGTLPLQSDGISLCSDPSVTADLKGNFYYAHLDVHDKGKFLTTSFISDVDVAKSTDGGRTFPGFVVVARGVPDVSLTDKPYIAADARTGSRFKGNVYLSYTFENHSPAFLEGIRVTTSTDGGATWSTPFTLDSRSFPTILEASLPVVAPDGTVYVIYSELDFFQKLNLWFCNSRDGGKSWNAPAPILSGLPSPGEFKLRNGDPKFYSSPDAGLTANSFPTAAITPDGTIWVAWIDFARGACNSQFDEPPCENSDVRLTVSRDGGKNWTAPVKVTDETDASDQFFPWIAAHPNGLVSLMWLDRRLDPANVDYDVYYTNTFDGVGFSPNVRVTTTKSVLGNLTYIGDYSGLAATANGVFPIWTDRRDKNNLDVFTARGALGP